MECFERLGVDEDADERAIKRAYAAQLKRTRPDEDPAGFQALNEAYQQALYYARQAADTDEPHVETNAANDERVDALPVSSASDTFHAGDGTSRAPLMDAQATDVLEAEAPAPSPPPLPVESPEIIAIKVLTRARAELPHALKAYLLRNDALYALAIKRQVGGHVLEYLYGDGDPVPVNNVSVLAEFFNFQAPPWLESRLRVRRAVDREETREYGEEKPLAIRQLKRRFFWLQALLMACVPGLAARIFNLSQNLEDAAGGPVPGLDPRQHQFFARIANPFYFGAARWMTVLITSVIVGGIVSAIALGLRSSSDIEDRQIVAVVFFLGTAVLLCAWHGVRLMWGLQLQPPARARWAAELAPVWPALLALGLACIPGVPAGLPYALALPAAVVYMPRALSALRMGCGVAWLSLMLPQGGHWPTAPLAGFAGAAILMALFDWAYARRRDLPLAAVRDNRWTYIGSYLVLALGVAIWFAWYRRWA